MGPACRTVDYHPLSRALALQCSAGASERAVRIRQYGHDGSFSLSSHRAILRAQNVLTCSALSPVPSRSPSRPLRDGAAATLGSGPVSAASTPSAHSRSEG